jgi:tetratricopeptide (TPR) repeat protein
MSETAWDELASLAHAASRNEGTLGDALLVGLEDPVIWSRIGSFFAEFAKDYKKAIAFYDRAITIDRNVPNFYLSKAQIYAYNLNDFGNAKTCLDLAHKLGHRKLAWYKSKERAGVFTELENYIVSNVNASGT